MENSQSQSIKCECCGQKYNIEHLTKSFNKFYNNICSKCSEFILSRNEMDNNCSEYCKLSGKCDNSCEK